MYYDTMDKELKKLKKNAKGIFLRYKTKMGIDEHNIIQTSKEMYKKLDEMNRKAYLTISKKVYEEETGKKCRKINRAWILSLLLSYDMITKYVYVNEVDRKRSRFAEAYIASNKKNKEIQTAFNLWWKQSEQYAIEATDKAVVEGYTGLGIKKVRWNTEKDDKVCEICQGRNGKVYEIDKIPKKPHYGCRCWFTPVRGKEED